LDTLDGGDEVDGEAAFVDAGVGARFQSAGQKDGRVVLAHDQNAGGGNFLPKKTRYVQPA
jgi:hypothetical protein